MNKLSPSYPNEMDLWQALQLFNLYRFILAFSFWILLQLNFEAYFFYIINKPLYQTISLIYFLGSVFILAAPFFIRTAYTLQINLAVLFDILCIILFMHACGGISSGIGILLVIIIAAHSLLVPERWCLLSAALATLGLIFEHLFNILQHGVPLSSLTQVGFLGTTILLTSFIVNILSSRIHQHQITVAEQAHALALSQQLNAYIISTMHEGLLAFNKDNTVQLINLSAYLLLDLPSDKKITHLHDLPSLFQDTFNLWKQNQPITKLLSFSSSSPQIRLDFHAIGNHLLAGTLAYIYDATQEMQRAQDLKLASLGHLTANIAHELRNPMGAISHATQLLGETSSLSAQDQELLKMIKHHSDKMNTVIKNVLSIAFRTPPNIVDFELIPWLTEFIETLSFSNLPRVEVRLEYTPTSHVIHVDPSQFSQILINLCENGLRYSFRHTGRPTLTLLIRNRSRTHTVLLDVLDQGVGISESIAKHIFEPFFTTEKVGSGLGLYLAKELSNINGIQLEHVYQPQAGGRFRLILPAGNTS